MKNEEAGKPAAPVWKKRRTERKVYLEALRIIAIVFILFLHQPACKLFLEAEGPLWWLYAALSVLTRMDVPLFFMISGVLLLDKQEDLRTLLRKRVLRHGLVLVLFSGIYYLIYRFKGGFAGLGFGPSLWEYVCGVFGNSVEGAAELWFLYAYLGFLLMLPFMRRIAEKSERKDLVYLLILRFSLFSLLPVLNFFLQGLRLPILTMSEDFRLPLVMIDAFFFPYFGYLLEKQVDTAAFGKKETAILLALLLFAVLEPVIFTFAEGRRAGEYTQNFITQYEYVISGCVFLLIKLLFTQTGLKRREGIRKAVLFIGPLTFGIYLFDRLLKEILWAPYYLNTEPHIPTILMSAGWILMSFVICGAFTWLLKKVPGIRKLI